MTIENSDSSAPGTPLLFKSPTSPPKRKALIDVNKKDNVQRKGMTSLVTSKTHVPKKPAHVAKDPFLERVKSSEPRGISNQGAGNRKRKLLSMSHSTSFFKPLTDS